MRITERISVSILFFVNGLLIGNWAPKIPEFAKRLSLDESGIGIMIAIFGLGCLITMPIVGLIIARIGTSTITKLTSLIAASALLLITIAPNFWLAAIAMFIAGGTIAGMDVAMNTVAVEVEKKQKIHIMASCHGFWSLGGLFGAISGGYFLENTNLYLHAIVVTISSLILVIIAFPAIKPSTINKNSDQHSTIRLPRHPLPYLVGIIALFSAIPEGSVIDWSALYLRQELNSSTFTSAIAFAAFSGAMATVRFLGDSIRKKYGDVNTLKVSAIIAAIGLFIAGQATFDIIAIIGFFIAGLGMSNLVPIAFSIAGNIPNTAPSINLSIVTTIGYSGILVAPALIGYIATFLSLSFIFTALAGFLIFVFILSSTSLTSKNGF